MIRLYSPHLRFDRLCRRALLVVSAFLFSLSGLGQEPGPPTSLQGVVRDAAGKAVAEASILMRKKDSTDSFLVHTDTQGNYSFTLLPGGVYSLQATKDGYAAVEVSAVFLRPRESKIIDLTLAPLVSQGSATAAPQFFDQPQFTVAGVTDTTNLGGHGSDTIFGRGAPDVLWGDYKPSGQSTAQVDHLYGGAGDDFIYASHGRNIISGGLGNDAIHAHFGYGSIDCGGGYDTLFISHRSKPGYRIRHCERISFKTVGY